MKKLSTKELVFVSIILVIDIILTGPLLATLGMVFMSVGLQVGIASALVSGILYSIMLRRVPVAGVLSTVSIIRGILSGFVVPGFWPLFPVVALTGIIPDLIIFAGKLNPAKKNVNILLITLNRALTTPLMVPLLLVTGLLDLTKSPKMPVIGDYSLLTIYIGLAVVSIIAEALLGFIGALAGNKIADKLVKSGVE
ncbi:MAG: MptD family putative ECF transporter S component [Bacteroidota bacterium]